MILAIDSTHCLHEELRLYIDSQIPHAHNTPQHNTTIWTPYPIPFPGEGWIFLMKILYDKPTRDVTKEKTEGEITDLPTKTHHILAQFDYDDALGFLLKHPRSQPGVEKTRDAGLGSVYSPPHALPTRWKTRAMVFVHLFFMWIHVRGYSQQSCACVVIFLCWDGPYCAPIMMILIIIIESSWCLSSESTCRSVLNRSIPRRFSSQSSLGKVWINYYLIWSVIDVLICAQTKETKGWKPIDIGLAAYAFPPSSFITCAICWRLWMTNLNTSKFDQVLFWVGDCAWCEVTTSPPTSHTIFLLFPPPPFSSPFRSSSHSHPTTHHFQPKHNHTGTSTTTCPSRQIPSSSLA